MPSQKIIYSRGFPYGAPLVMIRGGGTREERVKNFLRSRGFHWDNQTHSWKTYMNRPELREILIELRDSCGMDVVPKDGMDASYVIEGV